MKAMRRTPRLIEATPTEAYALHVRFEADIEPETLYAHAQSRAATAA